MRLVYLISVPAALMAGRCHSGEAAFNDRKFQFAAGFSLEVAATPPLVERPIEADFDGKGRLYVTESSGSNEPVGEQLKKKPHRVLRLTDSNRDGVFDGKTVFADGLMFPEGILCHGGAVYVAAPPQIWKFTDANDDGVAEMREIWFDGKTLTGCANDLHGPYAGPDGLIYWCKGAFAEQTHDLPGKPGWKSRASHVFRAKPDGTGIECVFTAGMDNPVGLAWTPEGDLMVSGTFLQHPEAGRRDGIIHAVRGGVWGKDHDVLNDHPRTGPLMPAMTHLGPAAAAGMCRYGRDLLVCQFNMRTVSRHELIPNGASYRTVDSPLLTSDHPDFHPTDVFQSQDGSLLVIDTGGWYKLCCPTSQLAKPEVPGAIYRLRKVGGEIATACPPPRWRWSSAADFSALCAHLKSENQHLRRRAIEEIGQWPAGRATAAEKAAAAKELVPVLLDAAQDATADRFIEHALIYALIEGGDPETMRDELPRTHPAGRRLLLHALAQTNPSVVDPRTIGALLPAADDRVMAALLFSFARVPAWRTAAKEWLSRNLAAQPEAVMTRLVSSVSGTDASLLPDLGGLLREAKEPALRLKLLEAMRPVVRQEGWPAAWGAVVLEMLRSTSASESFAAAEVLSNCRLGKNAELRKALEDFAGDAAAGGVLRLQVLSNPEMTAVAARHLSVVLALFSAADSPTLRMKAAEIISRTTPGADVLGELAGEIGRAGLLERPLLLRAFRQCEDEAIGSKVVDQLESAGALTHLPQHVVDECLGKFPTPIRDRVKVARQKASADQAAQLSRLNELEKALPAGDVQRGSVVFQHAKASCVLCHKIGYRGGSLGPDLSRVGAVRTRRDLLEAVVFPSASFVRSYEPVEVEDGDGSKTAGIIRNQSAESITLGTGAATPEIHLKLSEVKSLTAGTFSLMPAGVDQILTPQELADLIAFLQSMK